MPKKILVVDDDLATLQLVGLMLERQGYEVLAANKGIQALTMAQSETPDLILLDLMIPDIDGYEIARRLRGDPKTTDVPIIMFTAKTQTDDKLLGFEVGADDYLTKPAQPLELIAHIKAVLTRTSKSQLTTPIIESGSLIGVLAARGGLGVSTLALNLGIAIKEKSQKEVIVAEFRPGQGSLGLELGYLQPKGFNKLLQADISDISPAAIESELIPHNSGIRLLLSSPQPRNAQFLVAADLFEAIAKQLPALASYIVLDLGPALSPITVKTIPHCNELIIIVDPVPQIIHQTKSLIQDLLDAGVSEGRINVVLINRSRSSVQPTWTDVEEQLGRNITIMITPAPELAYQASLHNIPIILQQPDSLTSEQFFNLAEIVTQRSRSPAI